MLIRSRFIVDCMFDGASLEQAIALVEKFQRGEKVTLANLKGGTWVSSPFDWVPTVRTMRAAVLFTASLHAIKVTG